MLLFCWCLFFLSNTIFPLTSAFRIAVDQINSNSNLLPHTELKFAVQDSRSSHYETSKATKYLLETSKVDVILLGGGDVFAAHEVAPNLALVGHSSTSPKLSDKSIYPNFVRTCISSSLIARNIAAFIRSDAIGATHLSIISGSDTYSSDLAHSFLQHANSRSIHVLSTVWLAAGSTHFVTPITNFFQDLKTNHEAKDGAQYLVVVFAQAIDTINVLKAARASGQTGQSVTWILTDAVLDESDLFQQKMGTELEGLMAGSFVVRQDKGQQSVQYASLWNTWKSKQTTAGTPTPGGAGDSSGTTYGVRGTGPTCNAGVDSDGTSSK